MLLNSKQHSGLTNPGMDKGCAIETNFDHGPLSSGVLATVSAYKVLAQTWRQLTADPIKELTSELRVGQQG